MLPLGISYYILKLSTTKLMFTGKVEAEKDPIAFAAYVLFFPQLIVGPIIKYRDNGSAAAELQKPLQYGADGRGVELFFVRLAKR